MHYYRSKLPFINNFVKLFLYKSLEVYKSMFVAVVFLHCRSCHVPFQHCTLHVRESRSAPPRPAFTIAVVMILVV